MDTPKGGAHNAREPAWPEHNSTPDNGSQGRAAQKKKPLCQGCAAPVGLGLDNAATMGRRTAADGSPGGPLLQRSSGGPQPAGTAWRLPGAPSGGGGDGKGAGEKLPGQSRRGCVQSQEHNPRKRAGGRGQKKGGEAAVAPGDGAKRPLPGGGRKADGTEANRPPAGGRRGKRAKWSKEPGPARAEQGRPERSGGSPQQSGGWARGLRPDPSPRSRKAAHTGRGGARWGRRPGPRAAGPARSGPAQRSGARGDAKWRKRPPGAGAGTDPGPEKGPGPATLEGMGPTKGGPMRDGGPLVGWGPGPLACEICVGPFPSVGGSPFT